MVSRERWAGLAAAFWAAVVFMPVGLNYLGFAVMLLALCVDGRWRERVLRLRASALWWPLAAYVGWTLFVLVVGPHYPETAFNLWHGLRIAATIAAAMTLTDAETSQG
ncbi:MAG: hypothetical protein ABIQ82_14905, partial [Variovorax sp.]